MHNDKLGVLGITHSQQEKSSNKDEGTSIFREKEIDVVQNES